MPRIVVLTLLFGFSISRSTDAHSEDHLTTAQAYKHIGEAETVCGVVAGTKYAEDSEGAPTFINLDVAYPRQIFTALVWGPSRVNFPSPPESIHGRICISGMISTHHGIAQIIVTAPSQIFEPY